MLDKPAPSELFAAVVQFLRDELMPQLAGHHAFQLRVSCNALELIARQMALEPAANTAEIERVAKLLGHGGELSVLNAELAQSIADAKMTLATPGLADHLWATTLAKLAIDQPRYGAYQTEMARKL